ncbi:MAG: flagellar biosynthetic protein FliO [Pseudorhodobacter sp.]|nr:flagellar biosynthetic protein FliO [Frankiaceae bacterium]
MSALLLLVKVACVFGLLALVLWVLRRTDGLGAKVRGGDLEVRSTTRLGKGAAITLLRVDGHDLVLGVTDHTVTLLTRTPSSDEPIASTPTTPAARVLVTQLINRLTASPLGRRVVPGSADVPAGDVATALARLQAPLLVPAPRAGGAADGSSAPLPRSALRRAARTDAQRDEEHPWTRACRPTFRPADGDDALL